MIIHKSNVALVDLNSSYVGSDSSALYTFLLLSSELLSILLSLLNKLYGVFRLKSYIMDDALIFLGDNFIKDYFMNQRDRYIFLQGSNCYTNYLATVPVALCTMINDFKQQRGPHQTKFDYFTYYF